MKAFRFRLERVRQFRAIVKKEKERELSRRNLDLFEAVQRREEIRAAQDAFPVPEHTNMSVEELLLIGQFQEYLSGALERQEKVITEADSAVEGAKREYIQRAREEQSLDMLKSKRKEEYCTEMKRSERKERDRLWLSRQAARIVSGTLRDNTED